MKESSERLRFELLPYLDVVDAFYPSFWDFAVLKDRKHLFLSFILGFR